jgi:hypothetical protein
MKLKAVQIALFMEAIRGQIILGNAGHSNQKNVGIRRIRTLCLSRFQM